MAVRAFVCVRVRACVLACLRACGSEWLREMGRLLLSLQTTICVEKSECRLSNVKTDGTFGNFDKKSCILCHLCAEVCLTNRECLHL